MTPQLQPTEVTAFVAAFKDSAAPFEKGIHVAGTKYFCIKADDRSLYGKQVCSHLLAQEPSELEGHLLTKY